MNITERFMKYISMDTVSDEYSESFPSTASQFVLAGYLADEMKEIGISNVRLDKEHCYVYGEISANTDSVKTLGFISHMDTAPGLNGNASAARIIRKYGGGKIELGDGLALSPDEFPEMNSHIGEDFIVTDGTTLLGADDKAGIAEIMTMAERLIGDQSIRHGKIVIAFTPDEEIGAGTEYFDIPAFGADYAYTVDGGAVGEIEYENFNAAFATVKINGKNIHPGSAKNIMLNAARIAAEFDSVLPQHMRPEYTDGYDGFFHMTSISGDENYAEIKYLIRDHDAELFDKKKEIIRKAAEYLNLKYNDVVSLDIKEQYRNMKELILPHIHLIDSAKTAFIRCGVEPKVIAIRGGTDGAMLTYQGLPCPNLSTGGHNFHSKQEYITVQSLEKMTEVLIELAKMTSERN